MVVCHEIVVWTFRYFFNNAKQPNMRWSTGRISDLKSDLLGRGQLIKVARLTCVAMKNLLNRHFTMIHHSMLGRELFKFCWNYIFTKVILLISLLHIFPVRQLLVLKQSPKTFDSPAKKPYSEATRSDQSLNLCRRPVPQGFFTIQLIWTYEDILQHEQLQQPRGLHQ